MIKRQSPTITQANIAFFITAVITLVGSAFFQPRLGVGTNLWINEFVYILFPPLLLVWINGWSVEDVYRFRKTSIRNMVISVLAGLNLWFFAFYVSRISRMFLDNRIGLLIIPDQQTDLSIYQSILLLIGMIVLAPICEETFFRGFMQRAYEGHSKRHGFVATGIIFGSYHVLNGISEVFSACILGLAMGYLVYKTDSIATSMIFHAAANTCAIALGGVFAASTLLAVPAWLHIIAFGGLGLTVVFLRSLTVGSRSEDDQNISREGERMSGTGVVFLALSAIFLVSAGTMEIIARLG